ncbi:MAG: amidohydrolase family protein [Alphaproteobacteria bacterium]|nr:amidohydrolase family protein [Alphaproteobacteria bacterium]
MAIVIRNATVVTVDADDTIHYDAGLAVEGGRIAAIGPSDAIVARFPRAEVVDADGKAVFPGFANVHTHFPLIIAKGIYEDLSPSNHPPFTSGLSAIPTPTLSREEKEAMVRLAALEAIRSGTTAALEDGGNVDSYARSLADTGLRLLLCEHAWDKAKGSIGDQGGFEANAALGAECVQRLEALHAKWHGAEGGRITVGVSAWAPDMCSPDLLRKLSAVQQRLNTVATIHLNQFWGEVAAVETVRGRKPTEYLADLGFLNDRLICAHCRCMSPEEEALLGKAKVGIAFNSTIAARRGLSPRIDDLERHGATIGLGTDNMSEDMVEAMRTALFMERVRRGDGREPTPEQVLRWATANGYRLMGIPDGGSLEVGNRADLIMIDLHRAPLVPHLRVVSTFVHQGQPQDVTDVMVDGRWLMRENRVLTMNEAATVAEAQRIAETAWARLFAERPDLEPQRPRGWRPAPRDDRAAAAS